MTQLLQVLPMLLLVLFSLFSTFSSDMQEQDFSFSRNPAYRIQKTSAIKRVPYFITGRTKAKLEKSPFKIRNLEKTVELEFHRLLQQQCANERIQQQQKIRDAHGWFSTDQEKLKAAQSMNLRYCTELNDWAKR